jgi:hypothetical protein
MGDRPALTDVERFCQRILANDPEEALEYAEELLKDHSLIDYYDEVVIKGLQLVASDVERSPRGTALLARVQRTMTQLINELDGTRDRASSDESGLATSTAGAERVLCVAVNEPLDRVVAEIVVRLMIKQGLRPRIASFGASAFEAPDGFDAAGADFVCVCGLDVSLNPAQCRYAVRRVRRLMPDIPIIVGLAPTLPELNGDQLRREIGADRLVFSLREAVLFQPEHREPRDQVQEEVAGGDGEFLKGF